MNIKNPYKLIEKANCTFNLYLEKYEIIEKFMIESKKEQEELKQILNNFLEEYESREKKIDYINKEFSNSLENLINEYEENKKSINELESKLVLHGDNTYKDLNNLINQVNEEQTQLNINNHNKIKNLEETLKTNNDNTIQTINQTKEEQNQLNINNHNKTTESINNIENKITNLQKNTESINSSIRKTEQKQDHILKFLDSQNDVNNDLKKAVNLFTNHYAEFKTYFFKNKEESLKQYFDTDELFRLCYFNNIQFLSYSESENKILLKTKENIILASNNRFRTIIDVMGLDTYSTPLLYQFSSFVVFDIGMNRAYASLRFADFDNCSAVYGFEIDEETYSKALYNINLNPKLSHKIKPYNFGLSDKNEEVKLYYLEGADGVSTIEPDILNVTYQLKKNKNKIKTKHVKVKKATEVLDKIIKKEKINTHIILKIDTEGSEYKIFKDLIETGLINKFDIILGEGHKINNIEIDEKLMKYGFKQISKQYEEVTYTFVYIKEEFYDLWHLKE